MPAYLIAGILILIGLMLLAFAIVCFVNAAGGWTPFNISSITGPFGFKFKGRGSDLIQFDDCKFTVDYKYDKYRGKITRDVTNILNLMARVNYNATPFQNDKPSQNVMVGALTPISFLAEDSLGNILEYPGIDSPNAKSYLTDDGKFGEFYNYGIYKFKSTTRDPDPDTYCTIDQLSKLKEGIMDDTKFNVAYICTLTGKVKNADLEIKTITDAEERKIYPIRFNSYGSVFKYKCPVVCNSPTDLSCIECCKRCYTHDAKGNPNGLSDAFPNNCGCSYKSICETDSTTKDCYKLACPYNVDKTMFTDASFSWNSEFKANRGANVLTGNETGDDLTNYINSITGDYAKVKNVKTSYNHSGFIVPYNQKQVMWRSTDTNTYKCYDPYTDKLSQECKDLKDINKN